MKQTLAILAVFLASVGVASADTATSTSGTSFSSYVAVEQLCVENSLAWKLENGVIPSVYRWTLSQGPELTQGEGKLESFEETTLTFPKKSGDVSFEVRYGKSAYNFTVNSAVFGERYDCAPKAVQTVGDDVVINLLTQQMELLKKIIAILSNR